MLQLLPLLWRLEFDEISGAAAYCSARNELHYWNLSNGSSPA